MCPGSCVLLCGALCLGLVHGYHSLSPCGHVASPRSLCLASESLSLLFGPMAAHPAPSEQSGPLIRRV